MLEMRGETTRAVFGKDRAHFESFANLVAICTRIIDS